MVKKIKKLIVVALALLVAFCFCACNAGVDVYESSDENNLYFKVAVKVDITLNSTLDRNSDTIANSARKWTVKDWLIGYFAFMSASNGFESVYSGKTTKDGMHNYVFDLKVSKNADMFNLDSSKTFKENLFLRTYNVSQENRFNPFVEQFNDVYPRFKSNTPLLKDYSSFMGVVLFGKRDYFPAKGESDADGRYIFDPDLNCCYKQILPSFSSAFPAAGDMGDYMRFALDNYWFSSNKVNVVADGKIPQNGGAYYYFHKTLADPPSQIEYSFYRAISAGWYLVSILAGFATIAVIYLICKIKDKRKKTDDTVKDMFPFDPFS